MIVLPGVLGCSFDRLRTGGPCDVPFRFRISDLGFLTKLMISNLTIQISPFNFWF
jgi:hypothetical protein